MKNFRFVVKSMLETLQDLAKKDFLYIIDNLNINLINSQIYVYNLTSLVEKNLLYVMNLLINSQIYT